MLKNKFYKEQKEWRAKELALQHIQKETTPLKDAFLDTTVSALTQQSGNGPTRPAQTDVTNSLTGPASPGKGVFNRELSETRARAMALKHHAKELEESLENDDNTASKYLEVAYRYLVKTFEILEATHGPHHPSVGASCLSIASVQNLAQDFSDTRVWLLNAMRYMEKLTPHPARAIAFTQVQLSNLLLKQGHTQQAQMVLDKAASYHMEEAKKSSTSATPRQPTRLPKEPEQWVLPGPDQDQPEQFSHFP